MIVSIIITTTKIIVLIITMTNIILIIIICTSELKSLHFITN